MKKYVKMLILAGLLCHTESIHAAGFYLSEHSVSSMGTAFAANTTGAEDATTVFLNPAGMTSMVRNNDFVAGITYIIPNSKYRDHGTINALGNPMGAATCAHNTNGGQIGKNAWVPNLSYVKKFGCRWAAGISINAPYGLGTDYNDEWYGRYYATYSQLITTNITPAIAYDVTDNLTIGAGVSAQYLHVENKNMVDFGLISFNLIPQQLQPLFTGLPESQDGKVAVKGCGWGVGGNVGLLYKFNCDRTRIGVQYRSQIHYSIKNGHVKYHNVPNTSPVFLGSRGVFTNGGVKAKVTLPDVVSAGIMHRYNNSLTLFGDVQWTNWQTLKALTLKFKNPPPSLQQSTTTFKWKSVWRVSVGAKYDITCNMAFRVGYMYDKSPVRSSYYTSARVPDANRQLVACGFQYWVTECLGVDIAYAHTFFSRSHVNKTKGITNKDPEVLSAGGLKGRWRTFADLIGVQVHASF